MLLSLTIFQSAAAQTLSQNLLQNGDFGNQYIDWYVGGADASVTDEVLCIDITDAAANPWDVQIGQDGFSLAQGATYQIDLQLSASAAVSVTLLVGQNQEPWNRYFSTELRATSALQPYSYQFEMDAADSPDSLFALHVGGTAADQFCLDNVSIRRVIDLAPLGSIIFDDFAYGSEELGADGVGSISTTAIDSTRRMVGRRGSQSTRCSSRSRQTAHLIGSSSRLQPPISGTPIRSSRSRRWLRSGRIQRSYCRSIYHLWSERNAIVRHRVASAARMAGCGSSSWSPRIQMVMG